MEPLQQARLVVRPHTVFSPLGFRPFFYMINFLSAPILMMSIGEGGGWLDSPSRVLDKDCLTEHHWRYEQTDWAQGNLGLSNK